MAETATIDSLAIEIGASSSKAESEITKLATALGDLKSKVGSNADGLSKWAVQIKAFSETTKGIDQNSISAISGIAKSLKQLSDVGKISISKNLGERIGEIGKGLKSFKAIKPETVDNFSSIARALRGISGLDTDSLRAFSNLKVPEISRGAANGITRIARAISEIDDDSVARIRNFADAMSGLAGVDFRGLAAMEKLDIPKAPKGESALWTSFARTMGSEAKRAVQNIFELARALRSGLDKAALNAGKALHDLAKNVVSAPFKRFTNTVASLKKQLDGLTSSFARVVFYRAVRTIIKEIGDAMKYGEENAYWFSKQFGTATKYISEAYDEYMSATEMMKNQIGAAWATLFANIQPIIEAITDLVTRAAAAVTQFFAALGGKTTYLKATKYAKDWKDETDSATKAAKEWKNQILGFDEINRLDEQSDRGRNRASDNTPDYSQMFEEVAVESEIGDLASKMREMWNNQRWKDLGNLISKTLNNLFPTAETWKKWGKKIGKGITGAIQTAYTTLKEIKFGEWGESIGNGVSFALEAIDFETWGRLIVAKSKAAVDTAVGFLRGLDFKTVGASVGNFFRGAFDEASTWLDGYDWGEMSGEIWERVKSLIEGFDVPTFASSLGEFIVTAANSAADFLNGIDFTEVIGTVTGALKSFFDNIKVEDVKSAVSNLWEAMKKAFKESMDEIGEWLKGKNEEGYFTQLGTDFSTGLTNLIEGADELLDSVPWGEIGTAVSGFLEGLDWFEIMKSVFSFVGGKIVDAAKWVFSEDGETVRNLGAAVLGLKLAFTGAEAGLSLAAQALVLKILNPFGSLAPGIATATTAAAGKLAGLKAAIGSGLTAAQGAIGSALPAIGTAAIGVFDAALGAYDVVKLNEAATAYGQAWDTHMREVQTSLDTFARLYTEKGPDVAAEWARMVYSIDTSNMTLAEGQVAVNEQINKLWAGTPQSMWEGFKQGYDYYFGDKGAGLEVLWGDALTGVRNAFSFGRLKGETASLGAGVVDGMKTGVQNNMSEIATTIETELPKNVAAVDGAWEGLAKSTDTAWSDIKDSVTTATGDINDTALADTQTLKDEMTSLYEELGETIPGTFDGVELGVTETMSKMAASAEKSVSKMNESFAKLPKTVMSVFRDVTRTVQESVRSMQSVMNFQWSIPRPKIPRITWTYNSVQYGQNNTVRIPQFDVRWFGKGGVLNNPTLFGMGDAGAEALVPLERNTQWIEKVAREMNRQGASASAANDDVSVIIYTAAAQIVQAINDSANRKGNVSVNVNGREFFRATYDDQQAVARERGVSLVVG